MEQPTAKLDKKIGSWYVVLPTQAARAAAQWMGLTVHAVDGTGRVYPGDPTNQGEANQLAARIKTRITAVAVR